MNDADRNKVLLTAALGLDEWPRGSRHVPLPTSLSESGWFWEQWNDQSVYLAHLGGESIFEFMWKDRRIELGLEKKVEESPAIAEQATPNGTGQTIVSMVMHDMIERMEKGVETYGQALRADNGRDPLVDAYQEALDLAIYLKQALVEKNGG